MTTDNSIHDYMLVPAKFVMATLDIHESYELWQAPVFTPEFEFEGTTYRNILVQTLVWYSRNYDPKEWE